MLEAAAKFSSVGKVPAAMFDRNTDIQSEHYAYNVPNKSDIWCWPLDAKLSALWKYYQNNFNLECSHPV